jgi:hypothetical protein
MAARITAALVLLTSVACGGSLTDTNTAVLGPSGTRCTTSVTPNSTTASHGGGAAAIAVSTDRDCAWSASSSAAWIAVRPAAGQGSATITLSIDGNAQRARRTAIVTVNEERIEISQDGAPPPPPPPATGTPGAPPPSPPPPDGPGGPPEPEQPERPEQPKPEDPKPEDPKPEDPKPEDPKPEDPKPEDPKPEAPKPEQPKPEKPDKPDKPEKVDLEGTVAGLSGSCPSISMRVGGTDVATDGDTKFRKGSCADVRNGVKVEVKGERSGSGPVRAREVKVDR